MSEPTVDEIMEKAKQLCRLHGRLWSKLDFQNPMAQQIRTTARLAGEAVENLFLINQLLELGAGYVKTMRSHEAAR